MLISFYIVCKIDTHKEYEGRGDTMKFSDMLQYLRKRDHLSQKELADRVNVSTSSIAMYEAGERRPRPDVEEAIADTFNVSIDILRGIGTETSVAYHLSADNLSSDEKAIIELYRNDADFRQLLRLSKYYDIITGKKK